MPHPFLEYRHLEQPVDVSFVDAVFFCTKDAFVFFRTTLVFFVACVFTTANFFLLLLLLFLVAGGRPLGRLAVTLDFVAASLAFFLAAEIPLGTLGVSGSHLPQPLDDHRHFEHPAVFNTIAMELSAAAAALAEAAAGWPRRLEATALTAAEAAVAAAFRFLLPFSMT
jgi:hypothetical protein